MVPETTDRWQRAERVGHSRKSRHGVEVATDCARLRFPSAAAKHRATHLVANDGTPAQGSPLLSLIAPPCPPLRLHDGHVAFLALWWSHALFDARLRS